MATTHEQIAKALESLGHKEFTLYGDKISDIVWLTDEQATDQEIKTAIANAPDPQIAIQAAATQKAALLARLGITADEAKLLIG